MKDSSKVTNILLAIIAVCLLALVLRPAGILPSASAQLDPISRDDPAARMTAITASARSVEQQADATRAVATAIDGLAKSVDNVARAIEQIGQTMMESGEREAESAAGSLGEINITSP
jgi:hypothetical protein